MFGRKSNDTQSTRQVKEWKTSRGHTYYSVTSDPKQQSYPTRKEAEERAHALDNPIYIR